MGRYTLLFRRIVRSLGKVDRAIIVVDPPTAGISIPACSKCESPSVFVLPNGARFSVNQMTWPGRHMACLLRGLAREWNGIHFPRWEYCRCLGEGSARGGMIGIGSGEAVVARGVSRAMEGACTG